MSSFAAAGDNCSARHSSTCCFSGPKFLCIRSTPMARLSSSEKCFECFARTGVYTPETMFPNRRKCTRDIRCRSCRNGRFSQTRQKVEFYYSAAPFGRVFFFQFADIWNVFAESCRQVNLMVLLIDEDLPNLFGHREFAQMLTLADTLA